MNNDESLVWYIKQLTNAWEHSDYVNYTQLMFNMSLKLDHREIEMVLSIVRENQVAYGYNLSKEHKGELVERPWLKEGN